MDLSFVISLSRARTWAGFLDFARFNLAAREKAVSKSTLWSGMYLNALKGFKSPTNLEQASDEAFLTALP